MGLLSRLFQSENEGSTEFFDAEPSDINLIEPDEDVPAPIGDADSNIAPPPSMPPDVEGP